MPNLSKEDDIYRKLKTGFTHNEAITNNVFRRFKGKVKLRTFEERHQFTFYDMSIMEYRDPALVAQGLEPIFTEYALRAKEKMEAYIIEEYVSNKIKKEK